jgi:hypothetical protein
VAEFRKNRQQVWIFTACGVDDTPWCEKYFGDSIECGAVRRITAKQKNLALQHRITCRF